MSDSTSRPWQNTFRPISHDHMRGGRVKKGLPDEAEVDVTQSRSCSARRVTGYGLRKNAPSAPRHSTGLEQVVQNRTAGRVGCYECLPTSRC